MMFAQLWLIFIRPNSDHCLPFSVTHSLTHSLQLLSPDWRVWVFLTSVESNCFSKQWRLPSCLFLFSILIISFSFFYFSILIFLWLSIHAMLFAQLMILIETVMMIKEGSLAWAWYRHDSASQGWEYICYLPATLGIYIIYIAGTCLYTNWIQRGSFL